MDFTGQIAQLLQATIDGQQVNEAEAALGQLRQNPEFIPSLYQIAISNSSISLKKSAIIHITLLAKFLFKTEITPEIVQLLENQTLQLFTVTPPELRKLVSHLLAVIVTNTFYQNRWTNLPEIVASTFQQNTTLSFVLTRSIAQKIGGIEESMYTFALQFSQNFFNSVAPIIQSSTDQELIGLAFSCVSRIILMPQPVLLQFLQTTSGPVSAFVAKAVEFASPQATEYFGRKALRFLSNFVSTCGPIITPEMVTSFMTAITNSMSNTIQMKMYCELLRFLHKLVQMPLVWQLLASMPDGFIQNVMVRFFALTPEAINDIEHDPAKFVIDSEKFFNSGEYEDPLSIATEIMYTVANNIPDFVPYIINYSMSALSTFSTSQIDFNSQTTLFAVFRLFACVSNLAAQSDPVSLRQTFKAFGPLLESPYEIVRAAGFMVLSKTTDLEGFTELIALCMRHIVDPSLLVQYYAAIASSNFLHCVTKDEDVAMLNELFAPHLSELFQHYLQLANDFESAQLSNGICPLIEFFWQGILPIASTIAQALFSFLVNANLSNGDEFSSAIKLIQSLCDVIGLIKHTQELAAQLIPVLYRTAVETLSTIKSWDANERTLSLQDAFTEIFRQLLDAAMIFVPEIYWSVCPLFINTLSTQPNCSVSDIVEILITLIYRDNAFVSRGNIPNELLQLTVGQMQERKEQEDEWDELCKLLVAICMRAPHAQLIQPIVALITSEETVNTFGSITILNVLMILDGPAIFGNDALRNLWIQSEPEFPETIVSTMALFKANLIPADLLPVLVEKCFFLIEEEICSKDLRTDGFDEEADLSTPNVWFHFANVLREFKAFAQLPQIAPMIPEMRMINVLDKYAKKYEFSQTHRKI